MHDLEKAAFGVQALLVWSAKGAYECICARGSRQDNGLRRSRALVQIINGVWQGAILMSTRSVRSCRLGDLAEQ